MSDIFISYSSEDKEYTEKLASRLESQGWSVWWDRSIPVGKSYEVVIEEALDEAICVLVIWSKASVKSQWVRAESAEAQRQEKLFPINIDGSKPPLVYRALQTADFINWTGDVNAVGFINLMADIRSFIKKPQIQANEIPPVEKKTSQKSPTEFEKPTIVKKVDVNSSRPQVNNNLDSDLMTEQEKLEQKGNFKRKGFILTFIILTLLFSVVFLQENKEKNKLVLETKPESDQHKALEIKRIMEELEIELQEKADERNKNHEDAMDAIRNIKA